MTGYRIGTVFYKNFGPFEDTMFDFDSPGLTVIEGEIAGKRGCDSNGAGKSFLFDGVAWALFGRCIREKYKGDDVVRLGSKGGCSVTVHIVGGPKKIKITRHRKHPVHGNHVYLYVDGKNRSRGTDPATTIAIEKIIGMDFTSFCNSVAFGVREDVKTFFSAADAERKKVLERILGLELYAQAEKIAGQRLTALAEETSALELRRLTLQTALAEKRTLLSDLGSADDLENVEFDVSHILLAAKRHRDRLKGLGQGRADLKVAIATEESKYEEALAAWNVAHTEYLDQSSQLSRDRAALQHEAGQLKAQLATAKAKAAKFKKLAGKKCPECEQKLTPERAKAFGDAYEEEVENFEADLKATNFKVGLVDEEIEKLQVPEQPEVPKELTALQEELQEAIGVYKDVERQAAVEEARAQEMQDSHERITTQTKGLAAEIEAADEELASVEKEYVKAKKLSDDIEFWVDGFGNQGLKSFLIEAEIPRINQVATFYAQQLLGSGATVRLTATKALKTKDVVREKLTVEGSIPGCTKSYAGASKGQKKRMDLSLLLAFRELVATRQSRAFEQLFADEIFDGLDRTGAESICEVLREIAADCPVALITHDSRIKPVADRVTIVRHEKGRATLESPKAHKVKPKKKAKKVKKSKKRSKG
jgi:DNA repair exonuclease SbcCD ATPase subunit